ncbi:MAG: hypothetical protein AB9866_11715 [Syntrophobacteraceae bacterium]
MIHRIALMVALVLLAFPAAGNPEPKPVDGFCSIVALNPALYEDSGDGKLAGYLLGGWSKDGWLEDKAAASLLRGGEKYRFYTLNGEVGTGMGSAAHSFGEEGDPCYDTTAVSFTAAPAGREGLVAVAGPSNILPRVPRLLSIEQQAYKDAAAAILQEKGIARPEVCLTQVIRVDLDGDGVEEVLVSATHYAKGLSPSAARGDYSLVFLRRMVKGKVLTHLIEGDFYPKGVKFGAPGEHRVGAVLDLNGDGVMEIVLFGRYYEGDWAAAYRVEGGQDHQDSNRRLRGLRISV